MRKTFIASLGLLALVVTAIVAEKAKARPWGHEYAKLSPFEAVRYREKTTPEVRVQKAWYELLALNDVTAADLVKACQSLDPKDWQKRFEEDLVEVLHRTNHAPPKGDKVDLRLKDLATGEEKTLKDVPMTRENRQALWEARNKRSDK